MANIAFKKGSLVDFEEKVLGQKRKYDGNQQFIGYEQVTANITEGTLYLTEDEGGLYLGVSNTEVKRIQGSVVFYEEALTFKAEVVERPPYSPDVIYFISDSNALIRWDETNTKWIQLNYTTDEIDTKISNLDSKIDAEKARAIQAEGVLTGQLNSVGQTLSTINSDLSKKATTEALQKETTERQALASKVTAAESAITNINSQIAPIQQDVTTLKADVVKAQGDATAANNNANTRVLQTTYNEFIEAYNAFKEDVNTRFTNAGTILDQLPELQNNINSRLKKDGTDAMTGMLHMGNHKIDGVADATSADEAVNLSQLDAAETRLTGKINGVDQKVDQQNTKFTNIDTEITGIKTGLANTGIDTTNKIITLQNNMNANSKSITNLAMSQTPADTDAVNVDYVKKAIKANDAMTFKGTVGQLSQDGQSVVGLPTANVQTGDTYKVAEAGTFGEIKAKKGDLIINIAEDDETPRWVHISSGYEDTYLQKLVVDDNVIYLTDGVTHSESGAVSSLSFVSDNDNLEFSLSGSGTNLTVTASMTWGSFAAPPATTE